MAVVFRAAAAQHRARQAQLAEIHILSVSLGLRASLYLEPIPPPPEIHAAALLCLLRGAQRLDQSHAKKRLKQEEEEKRRSLKPNATKHLVKRRKNQQVGGQITLNLLLKEKG